MLHDFQEHINHKFPFLKGKKLLLATSGGIDSVVLAHLFLTLTDVEVSLAHCNFQLRGKESDLDEAFVKKLANEMNIPFFNISFNTNEHSKSHKTSIQVAARELRYEWFEKIRQENEFDHIITAHNKNDVLETFLFNLTRGSGLDGFTGIPEINGYIVRPLLRFTRVAIEEFARKNNVLWREDKSNASTKYARNKIRHNIIPVLQELNPSLLDTFDKTLENLQKSKQIINDSIEIFRHEIESIENGIQRFDISKIKKLS
ncbi:MAG: tRNA(Ile)-lysidine synthase, partial [Roseivirga sp.]